MLERPKIGERVLLVHLMLGGSESSKTADLCEFKELAISAGAEVIDSIICSRLVYDPKYLIGKGKTNEIQAIVKANSIELVLFNAELSASQERNLEKIIECRVLDRTGLILDIFAQRARTFEGKLQVELAQLQHMSTRLIRGWTHLERQKGGIGLRGPGETQLEVDKRLIRAKIKNITKRLEKVRQQREQNRRARVRAQVPTIALVGYTNSGKSTLFNALTSSTVFAEDQLFATLDPTLRAIMVPQLGKVIIADTVGFIKNLPHDLVDAFRATLEETRDADLLLHVIDYSDPLWRDKKIQVVKVLSEIGVLNVPVLEIYNKIDLLNLNDEIYNQHNNMVRISAIRKEGLDELLKIIADNLCNDIVSGEITLSPIQAKIRAILYDVGAVNHEKIDENGNFVINIMLRQQRWDILCAKFKGLTGLLIK